MIFLLRHYFRDIVIDITSYVRMEHLYSYPIYLRREKIYRPTFYSRSINSEMISDRGNKD